MGATAAALLLASAALAADSAADAPHPSATLSANEELVYSADPEAEAAEFASMPNATLLDYEGNATAPGHVHDRCQHALKQSLWREARSLPPYLYADPLPGVRFGARAKPDDPRIVYFIGVSRTSAPIMVSRLLLALYHQRLLSEADSIAKQALTAWLKKALKSVQQAWIREHGDEEEEEEEDEEDEDEL